MRESRATVRQSDHSSSEVARIGRSNDWCERLRFAIGLGLLHLLATGCSTLAPLPPVDLAAPGWATQRGQAVWKFGDNAPEVVGDLVVAVLADAEMFAQFSKGPLTVAVARADATRWELDLAMFQRRLAGKGSPDERFAFFQLARQLRGESPPAPWEFVAEAEGRWRLVNPRTGESLEGFWEP